MNSPLHAEFYADDAVTECVSIDQNIKIAHNTYRLRFSCPGMAAKIRPGQFLMVRLAGYDDPLIGRPLALYDVTAGNSGSPDAIDVVYLVKGKFTSRLQHFEPGQQVEVWGPLGNGFPPASTEHLLMVAGGVGQTPFLALAKQYLGLQPYGGSDEEAPRANRVTLCYGARTESLLAGVPDFQSAGVDVELCTEDGSAGFEGLVTERLQELLKVDNSADTRIVCCGPEPMMKAVAKIARQESVPCEVSLETPMACGIGICFSCVTRVWETADRWDYRRTCVEGPVFDAKCIAW